MKTSNLPITSAVSEQEGDYVLIEKLERIGEKSEKINSQVSKSN